jgi:urate oxidase
LTPLPKTVIWPPSSRACRSRQLSRAISETQPQNRLWDTMLVDEADSARKVYGDPRPPYGSIGLTLTR